jgi:hypothetical protein
MAIAPPLLALALMDRASAADFINPSFEIPSAAQAPQRVIGTFANGNPLAGPGVGWKFQTVESGGTVVPNSNCGVQENGSSLFHAPVAPDGQQTAWIENHCMISQSIELTAGSYTLSFKIAAMPNSDPANQKEQIQVQFVGQPANITPSSSTAFNEVSIPFVVTENGSFTLAFTGVGIAGNGTFAAHEKAGAFIDEVSLKGPAPHVSSVQPGKVGPADRVVVSGVGFGNKPGTIKLHFSPKSEVNFSGTNSDQDLTLHAESKSDWSDAKVTSEKIDAASSVGAVNDNADVDVTLTTADAATSNEKQVKFHDDAVITSISRTGITSGSAFTLKGWDFGDDPGKVTICFCEHKGFWKPNGSSDDNLTVSIASTNWKADRVFVPLPKIKGVTGQQVDITLTTKDGRKSNTEKVEFSPHLALQLLPFQAASVVTCSNQGVFNGCTAASSISSGDNFCFFGGPPPISISPNPVDTFIGDHAGCDCCDSDNGTDSYFVAVKNGWKVNNANIVPFGNQNGTVTPVTPPLLGETWSPSVQWHIGASGGVVNYFGDVYIKGPDGVPYQ